VITMFYSIRHLTRFRYKTPVSESLMELRMHPRTEGGQRCLSFQLSVEPRTRVYEYRDYLGNTVHHFDVPGHHRELKIVAEALVEIEPAPELPDGLEPSAWDELDQQAAAGDYWEMLMPSQFAYPSEALLSLIEPLRVRRRDDPLRLLRELNAAVYEWFEYVPKATRVDSPIDHAIEARKGVCQDFAHIMIALVRPLKIPAATSAAIFFTATKPRTARPPAQPTPGLKPILAKPAGSLSIPPTICWAANATFTSPSAAITPTCRQLAASTKATPRANSASVSRSLP